MADGAEVNGGPVGNKPLSDEEEQGGGEGGGGSEKDEGGGLSDSQTEVLERCLHTLKHAKNDSHTLAALLLITRLCPANQLGQPTLRRIFEAVGLNLPARLLVTAVRGSETSGLPPHELLSLGTALLAALSTDPEMASHPQLLTTIPLLLGILANGPVDQQKQEAQDQTGAQDSVNVDKSAEETSKKNHDGGSEAKEEASSKVSSSSKLDGAMAADCYQVLTAVCALPRGPDQLLGRGGVPALCQAVQQNQTLSHDKGLALLGCLLSGKTKDKAWSKHPTELLSLLVLLSKDFCQTKDQSRLDMCAKLVQFLPPVGVAVDNEELKGVVARVWEVLRPMMQAKLTPRQIGPILVLSACLLDFYGWELVGPPKFCCLLVNRACVEVRMGLEEPPGNDLSPELQHTLTGCYRIMEAAIEQACCQGVTQTPAAPPPTSSTSLSLQQSRQVLRVLEEAFSALMYHLQQVDPSRYGDPFIFATFRSLCSWLAEETSCLKEEVTGLLPFLISYSRSHLQGESAEHGLSDWMAEVSVREEREAWTGKEALRYLLPALCHLSAEEGPRKVLLTLDTPALLVDFLTRCWTSLKGKSGAMTTRVPSMETACSALLNFSVTEPERVRKDPCFRTLEAHLSEALPVLVHKPCLLVLAANYCTLGLMIGRLKPTSSGSVEASHRRFFSSALRFLRGALDSSSSPGPVKVSQSWEESWDEVEELWRLSLQALGGCVRAQPWIATLVREEGWLKHTLTMLGQCSALPDQHTQGALEEALCAMVDMCPICKREMSDMMRRNDKGALSSMRNLKKSVGAK
ncbi:neurochondrin [Notolabrus celidotus]|uniref:neurochondrin n=1 Tax=Notolabrus celidotus TaxID=1203425 RepID=UPI00149084C9|nr:neurochondrin [Notolabrus celidotus]XP_034560454.1 neurochondrin [Notolabrus celidotus]XP_034560455.1 neurochondrin [Notolabrus celidotus]